ncbi:hypothetical protein ACFWY6_17145 [Streptomyces sp. NPDC059037]|uniref:hypothetical protein n=1 Tax=Streptomyces sp. NPDC059037 TaxID=3346710 RepID=UPI003696ACAD
MPQSRAGRSRGTGSDGWTVATSEVPLAGEVDGAVSALVGVQQREGSERRGQNLVIQVGSTGRG